MFHAGTRRFALYADPRLQTRLLLPRILRAFGLGAARCAVRSDPHYRTSPA